MRHRLLLNTCLLLLFAVVAASLPLYGQLHPADEITGSVSAVADELAYNTKTVIGVYALVSSDAETDPAWTKVTVHENASLEDNLNAIVAQAGAGVGSGNLTGPFISASASGHQYWICQSHSSAFPTLRDGTR